MTSRVLKIFSIVILALILNACGEGKIDLSENNYEPKIVIDGFIYPHQQVKEIKILRNFPLSTDIDVSKVVLTNADVNLVSIDDSKVYKLTYNPLEFTFGYNGNDLVIDYNKTYRLEVSAEIDGKKLFASSTTTVPGAGLNVDQSNLGQMTYREKDANGKVMKFNISFTPSSSSVFHAYSVNSVNPSISSFIYENAYFTDADSADIEEDFDRFSHQYGWLQDSRPGADKLDFDVEWHSIWFYGDYQVILYAGDINFKDYLLTHNEVQEMDGNFHEPKFHINGDGIGVFASAIADTVHFKIVK